MPTDSYPKRTEQNVIDSDGTVIICHGDLTGGSLFTKNLTHKHKNPCLHIDLNQITTFRAAKTILDWAEENAIEILNVAGPRASKDQDIYKEAKELIEAVLNLESIQSDKTKLENINPPPPQTVMGETT